jgi:hypothetical protein
MSADGYITITGRIKDLIIRGGENIHPLEIENCLFAHPGISSVSVLGVPDERYGEVVAAFVVAREHEKRITVDEIKGWVREKLSHHLGKSLLSPLALALSHTTGLFDVWFLAFKFLSFNSSCDAAVLEPDAPGIRVKRGSMEVLPRLPSMSTSKYITLASNHHNPRFLVSEFHPLSISLSAAWHQCVTVTLFGACMFRFFGFGYLPQHATANPGAALTTPVRTLGKDVRCDSKPQKASSSLVSTSSSALYLFVAFAVRFLSSLAFSCFEFYHTVRYRIVRSISPRRHSICRLYMYPSRTPPARSIPQSAIPRTHLLLLGCVTLSDPSFHEFPPQDCHYP